jgi:N-glycosylase/DNA lyase
MNYEIKKDKILIYDKENFNAKHILECGQIFTYEKASENQYNVFSKDKMCKVITHDDYVELLTENTGYFEHFFDLKTDYAKIKKEISSLGFEFKPMLDFGSGIRILNQEPLETIVGFIISANNHIKRITSSMKFMRENIGTNMGDYYAFPTLNQLKECDEPFFTKAGLGYRAKQMVKAVEKLLELDLEKLRFENTQDLRNTIMQVHGVGGKVADCVLLFTYGKRDVFPVDTWIEKIYHDLFNKTEKNREIMRKNLVDTFGDLSGYVQQYLFYYKRSGGKD